MDINKYTKAQQEAIKATGQNVIVSAGAGSGKTQVLTERIVRFVNNDLSLVDKGYTLDQFLILTFTNLAAGEMKKRIRDALSDIKSPEANKVDYADICTFDSYALSLVKKYHFALNVSPDVKIIDSNIIDVRKRTIIERLFNEAYERGDHDFEEMIESYCFKDDLDLRKLLLDFYNASLLEVDSEGFINNFVENFYSDKIIEECKEKFVKIFENKKKELFDLVYKLPDKEIVKKEERTLRQIYLEYLSNLGVAETYDDYVVSLKEDTTTYTLFSGYPEVSELKKKVVDKIKNLKQYLGSFPQDSKAFEVEFRSTIPYANKLIELLKQLDKEICDFKDKYQSYEFGDIAKKALKLLKDNPDIKESLKNKYKMICVDEYQDTSVLQEDFINLIANDNLYMVGDVKQSIYRFRHARCDIFTDKYRAYKEGKGGIAIDLNANFRSRKEVLDDINYIFKQIMSEQYGDADYAKEHVIEYGNKDYIKGGKVNENKHLEVLVAPEALSDDTPEIEANLIARDVIEKMNSGYQVMDYRKTPEKGRESFLRPCKFSDFCILMDRGTQFETYAKIFNEYHIPLHVENDEDISQNDVVIVLTNILKMIKCAFDRDFSSDEFLKAYLSIARSFLFEKTDEELFQATTKAQFDKDPIVQMFIDVVDENKYLSTADLFETVINKLDFRSKCILIGNVSKCEKYLDTFFELFKTMSTLDYSIEDFILFMECVDDYDLKITLSSSGSSIDSVQIMNIHKSKGLEFGIVYFSGLKKQFFRDFTNKKFGVSTQVGLILPPKDLNLLHIKKELNSQYELDQDTSEKIRLLYVALTRTKEKMICIASPGDYNDLLKDIHFQQYNDFLETHDFSNMSVDDAFVIVFNALKEGVFAKEVFIELCKEIKFDLPYEVQDSDLDILRNMTIDRVYEIKQYHENVHKEVEDAMSLKGNCKDAALFILDKYLAYEIDYQFLNDCLYLMSCFLSDEFIKQIVFDENKVDVTDRSKIVINDRDNVIGEDEGDDGENETVATTEGENVEKEENDLSFEHSIVIKLCALFESRHIDCETFKDFLAFFKCGISPVAINLVNDPTTDWGKEGTLTPYIIFPEDSMPIDQIEETNEAELIDKLKEAYINNKISEFDILSLLNLLYDDIPFNDTLIDATRNAFDKLITLKGYNTLLKVVGVSSKPSLEYLLNQIENGTAEEEQFAYFANDEFFNNFKLEEQYFENLKNDDSYIGESLLKNLFSDFLAGKTTLDEFSESLMFFNFELTKEFSILPLEEKLKFSVDNLDDAIVERGHVYEGLTEIKSLDGFLKSFYNYRKFNHYTYDLDIKRPELNSRAPSTNSKLTINNIQVCAKEVKPFRPSKSLTLGVDKKLLDLGTTLHLAMEITDLANPDYSVLDSMQADCVKKFLSSKLCENISSGKAYKEYDFYDETSDVKGVIDLFIVYSDHVDIIDYKTKHIDDESYAKQLGIYRQFIERTFKKPTYSYLYSLVDGVYKEIN